MNGITILEGDCRQTLKTIPDDSVHCCVTSPPYFGLRDYKVDGQIGLEVSPAEYIAEIVAVFREVRRVLRDDGTLWLNLGDSYAGSWGAQSRGSFTPGTLEGAGSQEHCLSARQIKAHPNRTHTGSMKNTPGLKPKDLIGIPWRVAFALQEDGWYLRQDIIWHKPNPMPESVTDRCTKSHEYLFLLSKSQRYFYDHVAIQERAVRGHNGSEFHTGKSGEHQQRRSSKKPRSGSGNKERKCGVERDCPEGSGSNVCSHVPWEGDTRNKRSVWTVSTKPYKGAHFATFPPDLIRPCIAAGCPEGGTVLDPFGGSGTTAEVARQEGCSAILCELNPDYTALIRKRLQQSSLLP